MVHLLDNTQDETNTKPADNTVKFSCNIDTIYKANDDKQSDINKYYEIINYKQNNKFFQEDEKSKIWLDNKDLLCNCPKLKLNRKYLIMGKSRTLLKGEQILEASNELDISFNRTELISTSQQKSLKGILLDRDTFITEWRQDLIKRLRRFLKHFQNGKC